MHDARMLVFGVFALLTIAAAPSGTDAGRIPDSIELDSLVDLYDKVTFDHAMHARMVENCADCHHHTTGSAVADPDCARCHRNSEASKVVACRGCHDAKPFSAASMRQQGKNAYHADRVGLKGAYHRGCTGCHERMGGPTGCRDCHQRNKRGDAFFSAGAGKNLKREGGAGNGRH